MKWISDNYLLIVAAILCVAIIVSAIIGPRR